MRQQGAEHLWSEPVCVQQGRTALPVELLVRVLVVLAQCEGHYLCGQVGIELGLAGGTLDLGVEAVLVLSEAYELHRDDVRPLVQELVEAVLSVGSALAEDHGAGGVGHLLSEAVDVLAVGLHVQLLEMGREAAERLRVGQDRRLSVSQDVPQIDTDCGVHHGRVLRDVAVERVLVRLVGSREQAFEGRVAEGQREDHAAHCACRAVAASDVVVDEERLEHVV